MKLIDAHTHLSSDEYNADRSEMLTRAFEVCDFLIDIGAGTSKDAFQRAKDLADSHDRIFFTAGIHPHDADALGDNAEILEAIESLYTHPKCVAVGECGLDYYYQNSSREKQLSTFEWHITMAQKYKLPLMIHTRDAESDTQSLLKAFTGTGVFHCFTGTQELADFGVQNNFFISFSGIITFKNAQPLRDIFIKVPDENILVETDAPFLSPVPMRGKRNESAFVEYTARFLANLRAMSFETFSDLTSRNALGLFSKIPKPY
jgi:TatD DNase family protein